VAGQSLVGYVSELTGGLSYLATLDGLLAAAESDAAWPALLARLEGLRAALLASPAYLVRRARGRAAGDRRLAAWRQRAAAFCQTTQRGRARASDAAPRRSGRST
jgi:hypothetical protein